MAGEAKRTEEVLVTPRHLVPRPARNHHGMRHMQRSQVQPPVPPLVKQHLSRFERPQAVVARSTEKAPDRILGMELERVCPPDGPA